MRILRGELVRIKVFARPFALNRYFKNNSEPKLHIGCGSHLKEGWLNADKFNANADIYLNALRRMPFKANTFKFIHMEHLLEHIPTDRVPFFLSECLRILKPGGCIRIIVPDLDIYVKKYYEGEKEFFQPIIEKFKSKIEQNKDQLINKYKYWLVRTPGAVFISRAVRRFYHHTWMYDFETLRVALEEIGFKKATKQQFQESEFDEFKTMDNPDREYESLYVDAVK